jgi:hypothetical protein
MKCTETKVYGLKQSIKVAGYAMVSGDVKNWTFDGTKRVQSAIKLAKARSGSGHDSFLKGITVQTNLSFSLAALKELQRYHFFDFVTSTSTMHRMSKMDLDVVCNEMVDDVIKNRLKEIVIDYLEDPKNKIKELKMLYNIPTGMELTAGISTNYLQLKTIFTQRSTHRLPDWWGFCEWVESLPYSFLITGKFDTDNEVPTPNTWDDLSDYLEVEDFVFENYVEMMAFRELANLKDHQAFLAMYMANQYREGSIHLLSNESKKIMNNINAYVDTNKKDGIKMKSVIFDEFQKEDGV